MNESFQGLRAKLLFGAIGNVIATLFYMFLFCYLLKEPSKFIGQAATDPTFSSFWAVFFPGFLILGALSIVISLIASGIMLSRFENARQAMRTSNRWNDMLFAQFKGQPLASNLGLLAAPAAASLDPNTLPIKGSERVVLILKAEPFDLSVLLSRALTTQPKKIGEVQNPGLIPLVSREPKWEKVQVLCDPNGKTPRLIKNEQGDMWGVVQTRSAVFSQMAMSFVPMPKDSAS